MNTITDMTSALGGFVGASAIINVLNLAIYSGMIVLWIFAWMLCLRPQRKNAAAFRRATRALRRENVGIKPGIWEDEAFLGKGDLRILWSRFLNNAFFAQDAYPGACDIEDYINEYDALAVPGHAPFSGGLAALFTTLGILGTFIGLAIGTRQINMLSGSTEVLEAIRSMAGGMSFAFNTSIAGVICSVAYIIFSNIVHSGATNDLNEFVNTFRRHAVVAPVDPMTQMACFGKEQVEQLIQANQELESGLPRKIAAAIELAMQPMSDTVRSYVETTARTQVGGVDRIVTKFVESMNQSLGGRLSELGRNIHQLNQWQTLEQEQLKQSYAGVSEITQNMTNAQQVSQQIADNFSGLLDKLNVAQQQAMDNYGALERSFRQLEQNASRQTALLDTIGKSHERMTAATDAYTLSSSALVGAYAGQHESIEQSLSQATQALSVSAKTLQNSYDQFVNNLDAGLQDFYKQFNQQLDLTMRQLSEVVTEISASVKELPEAINRAPGRR